MHTRRCLPFGDTQGPVSRRRRRAHGHKQFIELTTICFPYVYLINEYNRHVP